MASEPLTAEDFRQAIRAIVAEADREQWDPTEQIVALFDAARAQAAEAGGLDAAWAEAEAALPEGWNWEDITRLRGDSEGEWLACARNDTGKGRYHRWGSGPTPAAALRALAAKLRATADGSAGEEAG